MERSAINTKIICLKVTITVSPIKQVSKASINLISFSRLIKALKIRTGIYPISGRKYFNIQHQINRRFSVKVKKKIHMTHMKRVGTSKEELKNTEPTLLWSRDAARRNIASRCIIHGLIKHKMCFVKRKKVNLLIILTKGIKI